MRDERGAFREASGTSQGTKKGQGTGEGKSVVKTSENRWVKSVVESVVEFFARTGPAPDARKKNHDRFHDRFHRPIFPMSPPRLSHLTCHAGAPSRHPHPGAPGSPTTNPPGLRWLGPPFAPPLQKEQGSGATEILGETIPEICHADFRRIDSVFKNILLKIQKTKSNISRRFHSAGWRP